MMWVMNRVGLPFMLCADHLPNSTSVPYELICGFDTFTSIFWPNPDGRTTSVLGQSGETRDALSKFLTRCSCDAADFRVRA